MDPRDSSPDPGRPEPPQYRHLPENPVDGTSPTERFDATLPPAQPYGRHAAPGEDQGGYDPSINYGPENGSEHGYGAAYGYQGEPAYQPEGTYPPTFAGEPGAYIPPGGAERSGELGAEAAQHSQNTQQPKKRRGLGAVWTSVILLLAAGVALLFFFLWIMDGGDGGRDRPTVTQVVPADTSQPYETPSSPETTPPSESPSDEPSDAPVEPAPPAPAAPNEVEEWGNQLNDDLNGLINDLENRFAG